MRRCELHGCTTGIRRSDPRDRSLSSWESRSSQAGRVGLGCVGSLLSGCIAGRSPVGGGLLLLLLFLLLHLQELSLFSEVCLLLEVVKELLCLEKFGVIGRRVVLLHFPEFLCMVSKAKLSRKPYEERQRQAYCNHISDLLLGDIGGQAGARKLDRGRRLNGSHG